MEQIWEEIPLETGCKEYDAKWLVTGADFRRMGKETDRHQPARPQESTKIIKTAAKHFECSQGSVFQVGYQPTLQKIPETEMQQTSQTAAIPVET